MPSFPLVFHTSPDQVVAWRNERPVSARAFVADVQRVAALLPAGAHVFNRCANRYRFAVGLCAALLAGRVTVLPPAQTPAAMRELRNVAPDTFCLYDNGEAPADLPGFRYPETENPAPDAAAPFDVPRIDADRTVAWLFTSGSTGQPQPHPKRWGTMVNCLRSTAAHLGLVPGHDANATPVVVGTVPPQHMYGFEMTALLPLAAGIAFSDAWPFYPADVARALAQVPAPRVLITSPVHLRALTQADDAMPPVALVLSATAPLPAPLARDAEQRFATSLIEIYGSTETGQIATRRTAHDTAWTLLPGVRLRVRGDSRADDRVFEAHGGHVETPTPLGDEIEPLDAARFLLHGRKADLINIAGKRTSLAYLNQQLNAIPGVVDGAFFMPDAPADLHPDGLRVARLAAFVVAPELDAAALRRALRERVDAAFLPRPLTFVAALPRDANGKLPRAALTALATSAADAERAALTFTIPPDHPALAGHFPGHPVVPGVVLLDRALAALGAVLERPLDACRLNAAKFPSPAAPGEPLTVDYAHAPGGAVRFFVRAGERIVASGVVASAAVAEADAV